MPDPTTFGGPRVLVLTSLTAGPKHGYAIIEDVAALCGVTMGPGTLYGALTALEEQGLIAPLPPQGRRRPYELTPAGRTVAAEHEAAWRLLVAALDERGGRAPTRRAAGAGPARRTSRPGRAAHGLALPGGAT